MSQTLLDNDVVLKLAQYDLFVELHAALDASNELVVLPTLKYRFHLNDEQRALAVVRNPAAIGRIKTFLDGATELHVPPDAELLRVLQGVKGIDDGEAVLIAVAARARGTILMTGDKRAIRALAAAPDCREIVEALAGRVLCFEQLIAFLLGAVGESVLLKLRGADWDTAIRMCASEGSMESALEGLHSYYRELSGQAGGLLAPFP